MRPHITVADLIALLQQQEPTAPVICLSDAEGNGHTPLYSVSTACTNKSGDTLYDPEWTAPMCCLDEEEWEAIKTDPSLRRVVLQPC